MCLSNACCPKGSSDRSKEPCSSPGRQSSLTVTWQLLVLLTVPFAAKAADASVSLMLTLHDEACQMVGSVRQDSNVLVHVMS